MTCSSFAAASSSSGGTPSLLGRIGRVAFIGFPQDESRYHFHNAFFHSTPSVLHMMLIHSLLVNRNDHAWAAGLCVWEAPPASAAKGAATKRPLGGVLRLRDIWNVQRMQFSPAAAESNRILAAHSFSGAAPPVEVHS